jgi:hypothetical protein
MRGKRTKPAELTVRVEQRRNDYFNMILRAK